MALQLATVCPGRKQWKNAVTQSTALYWMVSNSRDKEVYTGGGLDSTEKVEK